MSDWISVKDRLPEESGDYLVYVEGDHMYDCYFEVDVGDGGDGEFGYWLSRNHPITLGWDGEAWIHDESVTHWMPLPEPPKEG